MSSYKLTYFNAPGRAEVIRYLFVLAGQEFEDNRIEGRNWPTLKPTTAFGCVPELEMDGDVIVQTGAIVRYLATKYGMMGKTARDYLDIDVIMNCADDVGAALASVRLEKDDTRKKQMSAELVGKLSLWLPRLEAMLCRNKGGDGWFVGDSVTPADIYVSHTLSLVRDPSMAAVLAKCSKLTSLCDRFRKLPPIAEWIKKTQAQGPAHGGPPHGGPPRGGHPHGGAGGPPRGGPPHAGRPR